MTERRDTGERELCERLRALRVDPPDDGFAAGLRRKLVAAGPPEPRRLGVLLGWWAQRPVLRPALALAMVALVVGVAFLALQGPRRAPPHEDVEVAARLAATQVAVVRLTLAADAPVEAARIRVTLPAELAFWADGREVDGREITWTQALRSGDNEIPIAVRGRTPGRHRISIDTHVGAERVTEHIVLEVTPG